MTYILGARCTDGVVLISDQKVSSDTNPSYNKEKILEILPGIVMGGAGMSGLIERIYDDIKDEFEGVEFNINQVIRFAEKHSLKTRKQYKELEEDADLLIGMHGNPSKLYHIVMEVGFADPVKRYIATGSGEQHGSLFLEKLWKNDTSMEDFAKIGYFLIKYVITMKADDGVGGDITVIFMPDCETSIRKASNQEIAKMEKYTKEKLSIITECIVNLQK